MMDMITLNLSGNNRHISPEVFLAQVARALRGVTIPAGEHSIIVDREGGVWLDEMKVYTPVRPLIAKKGA